MKIVVKITSIEQTCKLHTFRERVIVWNLLKLIDCYVNSSNLLFVLNKCTLSCKKFNWFSDAKSEVFAQTSF
jgi:hypothetical protein